MQWVGLIDRLSQVSLGAVVELFDLVDFVWVENVFIADLLKKPEMTMSTVRNMKADFDLLKKKRALGLGASFSDSFIEVSIQVCLVEDGVNDVDGSVTVISLSIATASSTRL